MCGIAGIFGNGRTLPEREEIVSEMMTCLAHRGPDGEGLWSGEGVTLGHRRLAIIDVEHGMQPMHSEDGRYTISFNGEIYNYVELRQELTQRGVRFKTFSDTEVLLQALIQWGTDGIAKLNGMFAFAFLDNKTGEWLLCRDPFGIKPLYYSVLRDEIVFASEIKALLRHPEIKAECHWPALEQYLTYQLYFNDHTLFEGVQRLEPARAMSGRGGKINREWTYWDLNFELDEYHTHEYFIDRLRSLLEDSVKLQLRSDVKLGAYLSGGMDSSAVSALASQFLDSPLEVFTGRFDEGEQYDESPYAKAISEKFGCNHHLITPTAEDFVHDLPRLIYALDEPIAGPGVFPQYQVSKLAGEKVKVVLGGTGGDEIFGGYARYLIAYLEQALKGAIFETQEEGKHIVTLSSIIPNLPVLKNYGSLMQKFWGKGLFEPMDARYFRLLDRLPTASTLLSEDTLQRVDRQRLFEEFRAVFHQADTASYINKMTHFDLKTLLPALLQIEDRVSMAVSLESRVPLLDSRIAELVAHVPPPLKFQGGKTKYLFRESVRTLIPEMVLDRKDKMGFPVPLKEWTKTSPVREFVSDILLSSRSRERGLFRSEAVERLIDTEVAFGRQIWGLLCLELWHREFIDA